MRRASPRPAQLRHRWTEGLNDVRAHVPAELQQAACSNGGEMARQPLIVSVQPCTLKMSVTVGTREDRGRSHRRPLACSRPMLRRGSPQKRSALAISGDGIGGEPLRHDADPGVGNTIGVMSPSPSIARDCPSSPVTKTRTREGKKGRYGREVEIGATAPPGPWPGQDSWRRAITGGRKRSSRTGMWRGRMAESTSRTGSP